MNTASFSEAGRKSVNQDSVLVKQITKTDLVLAIADGMGGKPGGEIASKLALNTVEYVLTNEPSATIEHIFESAHSAITEKARSVEEYSSMGTTLTVVLIRGGSAIVGHVGDCRVYHLREHGIISRTKDQTELQQLLDEGVISKHRAANYHRKNILLSVLSGKLDYTLQKSTFSLKKQDRILLLSDGAYSLLKKIEIRDVSVKAQDIIRLASSLQEIIESKKIIDDYSCVAFEK